MHRCRLLQQNIHRFNEKRLPTGEICDVAGTAMDFREFHDIGSRIGEDDANAQTVSGYDHNYILPAIRARSAMQLL